MCIRDSPCSRRRGAALGRAPASRTRRGRRTGRHVNTLDNRHSSHRDPTGRVEPFFHSGPGARTASGLPSTCQLVDPGNRAGSGWSPRRSDDGARGARPPGRAPFVVLRIGPKGRGIRCRSPEGWRTSWRNADWQAKVRTVSLLGPRHVLRVRPPVRRWPPRLPFGLSEEILCRSSSRA